jgi:ankyrin repeat protein
LRQQLKRLENCTHRDDGRLTMKSQLITIVAAVLVVGCSKPPPPNISIHEAAAKGNIEAVKQHLAADTDVNAKGKNGWTPLHIAAANDHKELAELLIEKGANVNAKDRFGGKTTTRMGKIKDQYLV